MLTSNHTPCGSLLPGGFGGGAARPHNLVPHQLGAGRRPAPGASVASPLTCYNLFRRDFMRDLTGPGGSACRNYDPLNS